MSRIPRAPTWDVEGAEEQHGLEWSPEAAVQELGRTCEPRDPVGAKMERVLVWGLGGTSDHGWRRFCDSLMVDLTQHGLEEVGWAAGAASIRAGRPGPLTKCQFGGSAEPRWQCMCRIGVGWGCGCSLHQVAGLQVCVPPPIHPRQVGASIPRVPRPSDFRGGDPEIGQICPSGRCVG